MKKSVIFHIFASGLLTASLGGCAIAPASGPSARAIGKVEEQDAPIKVIDVTGAVVRDMLVARHQPLFSQELGDGQAVGSVIGRGDVLDIAIWEAPPAALFGSVGGEDRVASAMMSGASTLAGATSVRATSLPEQMVDSDGQITVPFVGTVRAAGRTPQDIGHEITTRLLGKAHQPQTVVRLVRNTAATVTVVGEVATSQRVPLTARGERILDVLASAGGVRQPVGKMTIQITRGAMVTSMPLEAVIRDPRQNVHLRPDDVMTVLFQPYSFTALGAIGRNEEVSFEATGVTLVQALGRVAGLQDTRANVKGVFIFRLENPEALDPTIRANARLTSDGKVPVIYRINMKDPTSFFIAQELPIRDKDLLYVSNAPLADFQKFVNVIYSTVLPVTSTAVAL